MAIRYQGPRADVLARKRPQPATKVEEKTLEAPVEAPQPEADAEKARPRRPRTPVVVTEEA
jgi:hypothetical protein